MSVTNWGRPAPRPTSPTRPASPPRPPVVLVVDDDGVARSVVAGILREAGMRTLEADSGAAALELLNDWEVDAALVDQSMPGMSGLELTRLMRTRAEHQLTPILFLSAMDSAETRLSALRAGATDFMVKPLPYEEIIARLEAQISLSNRWVATVQSLEARAGTLVALAGLGCESNPSQLARMICEHLSRAHDGAGVAIYACADISAPNLLASAGGAVDVFAGSGAHLALRGDPVPWIEHPAADPSGELTADAPALVVCCPLRERQSTLGVLTIDSGAATTSQEVVLAATVDYAPTIALLLGPALAETRQLWESRAAVERVLTTEGYESLFQPIVDISSGQPLGYEALTRLKDGSPIIELLSEAEEAGLRSQAELDLLNAALRTARTARTSLERAWLSVNLSPSVVVERTDELASLIAGSGCEVVVELTENERIEDYMAVGRALEGLGQSVRVSVDDTGSGYASLRHVIALHPHFLKLDRSWITGLDRDETRQALVAGMVGFCRHTGTEMIAEGVETQSELDTLRRLGVRLAQGYFLGRPAPLHEQGRTEPAMS